MSKIKNKKLYIFNAKKNNSQTTKVTFLEIIKHLIFDKDARKVTLSLLIVFGFITYYIIKGEIDFNRLKDSGICTKAIVFDKRIPGVRGIIHTYYRFYANGEKYENYSDVDDNAEVGDSIIIVYLNSDPSDNRSNQFLEKDCSCR